MSETATTGGSSLTSTTSESMITQMTRQEGAGGWACQHALSPVANVTVEAWACGYTVTDEAARIAAAMVQNARR